MAVRGLVKRSLSDVTDAGTIWLRSTVQADASPIKDRAYLLNQLFPGARLPGSAFARRVPPLVEKPAGRFRISRARLSAASRCAQTFSLADPESR